MSDPRLLSAEKLAYIGRGIKHGWEGPLLGHIAALTEQLATLRTEAAKLGHEQHCHAGWQSYPLAKTCSCAQSRIQGVKHERN